jgi:hypothetical protein
VEGCDTFTMPVGLQAAGRIYRKRKWRTDGSVSTTDCLTAWRRHNRNGSFSAVALDRN